MFQVVDADHGGEHTALQPICTFQWVPAQANSLTTCQNAAAGTVDVEEFVEWFLHSEDGKPKESSDQ